MKAAAMATQRSVYVPSITLSLLLLALMAVFQETTSTAVCQAPLGMADGRITNAQLSASTEFAHSTYHGANNARLNRPPESGTTGSWSTQTNDLNQWIQADLEVSTWVTGILLQGRGGYPGQWVTKAKVQYSDDGTYWKYVQATNNLGEKVFDGNSDENTVVTNLFATPVQTRFIRLRPTAWNGHISMRFEIVGCAANICQAPLGLEDGRITDGQITASTEFASTTYHGARNGRLNRPQLPGTTGGWSSQTRDSNQWIQADVGVETWVSGVMVQGRADYTPGQWVTTFKVQYSKDGEYWKYVQDSDKVEEIFNGSIDTDRAIVGLFASPVRAKFIRIRPITWIQHPSMRFEVLGC